MPRTLKAAQKVWKTKPAVLPKPTYDDDGIDRLITKIEVMDRVGVCYPTIWAWMREGRFPRARGVGGRSMWLEREVQEWIRSQPVRILKGDKVA
jgi:predicted DNA-binding transcriptional regulator AlpA